MSQESYPLYPEPADTAYFTLLSQIQGSWACTLVEKDAWMGMKPYHHLAPQPVHSHVNGNGFLPAVTVTLQYKHSEYCHACGLSSL